MPNEYTNKKQRTTKTSQTKNMEKLIIESLLTKYTNENETQSKKDDQQMVGYYTTSVTEDSRLVVCSPDLPITVSKLHLPSQVSSSTSNYPQQVTSSEAAIPLPRSPDIMTATITPPGPHSGPTKGKNSVTTTTSSSSNGAAGEDPYQCNICSKTFAVPARLTRHYRTHTGEKPFQCEYCAKSFSVKENLSVHRRIHTKERPYKCEVCARAFEHSGKLHRHMRIHTGERPHKCTVCSKTFIQSGQLVIHMRTHTGEKPYVCGVCTKGFTCSKQLKVHSRTHTGEKPYACDICGKCFGYNHVLKLHQVAHYGEKVYKCTICNDTFNSKKDMETHIKSHSDNASSSPSTSDKENTDSSSTPPSVVHYEDRYLDYLQPSNVVHSSSTHHQSLQLQSGVDLLAAAAVVSGINDNLSSLTTREDVINLITNHSARNKIVDNTTITTTTTATSNHPSTLMRHPAYFSVPQRYDGNFSDIRRRVEEVLEVASAAAAAAATTTEDDPLLITPPSSNPVSPAPTVSSPELSRSPDPAEERLQISLPPRKRSKMILKSMESEYDAPAVRYSSVIQYAKAL